MTVCCIEADADERRDGTRTTRATAEGKSVSSSAPDKQINTNLRKMLTEAKRADREQDDGEGDEHGPCGARDAVPEAFELLEAAEDEPVAEEDLEISSPIA